MYCEAYGYERMTVYGWYKRYVKSNYIALPFEGAWADQPVWLDHDFRICSLMDAYIADPPPTWNDVTNGTGKGNELTDDGSEA